MKPPIPGLDRLLGGLAAIVRTLPAIAGSTGAMERDIAVMRRTVERVAGDTSALPLLVHVQRDLAALPDTLRELDERIARLSTLLEGMLDSLDRLDASVNGLEDAVQPMGRIASRLPAGRRAAR